MLEACYFWPVFPKCFQIIYLFNVQEKKFELYQTIAKMEQHGNADGSLQVRFNISRSLYSS